MIFSKNQFQKNNFEIKLSSEIEPLYIVLRCIVMLCKLPFFVVTVWFTLQAICNTVDQHEHWTARYSWGVTLLLFIAMTIGLSCIKSDMTLIEYVFHRYRNEFLQFLPVLEFRKNNFHFMSVNIK